MVELDLKAMVAGGVAGLCVDVSLFPIDTVKSRIQSSRGFWASGGFSGVYNGLLSAAVGSIPGAALFFGTYENMKPLAGQVVGHNTAASHIIAASAGEIMACLVRVPTENVKQQMQVGMHKNTTMAVKSIFAERGFMSFMTGYGSTVMREIPFSMIQFPIWERLKVEIGNMHDDGKVRSWESAAAGSLSGAFAAAVTTPLDVVKTRLMLRYDAKGVEYKGMVSTFQRILAEEGAAALFSGIAPRTMWIGIGGFVYFGAYEKSRQLLQ